MASHWADALPRVTMKHGEPKRVTIVYPFYENHDFLGFQIATWWKWAEDLRPHVQIVIVDDGSPHPLLSLCETPISTRIFRIQVDVRWNWLAARNIGAHHAATDWILLTDIDHVVPDSTLRSIIFGRHDPSVVYAFARLEHSGEPVAPHSASFLMTRDLFWRIGGYDETLSGYYGTDGDWRRRVQQHATIQILTDPLIRYERVGDSSTTRYQRKQPEDAAVSRLIAQRGPAWQPKTLSFPYEEVSC